MTWTVFVTWGCQLGGGNEKECMSMVPPSLGAAPARRGAPAVRMPTAVPASTSRRVNRAPSAGTRAPASEANKAIILLLAAPLMEPCRKCIPGMRACQHLSFGELPKAPTVRSAGKWRLSPPLAIRAVSANVGKGARRPVPAAKAERLLCDQREDLRRDAR